jgi:mRNA-degrading endonuclease toxin of MazEF toxin-antitoxin module
MGLAPVALAKQLRDGAVFLVDDKAIDFPESKIPGAPPRTFHRGRIVIVTQAQFLGLAKPKTMLVVPCSTSFTTPGPGDYVIPETEAAFDRRAVALTRLVQPVLKSCVQKYVDRLSPETLVALKHAIAQVMGLMPPARLTIPDS